MISCPSCGTLNVDGTSQCMRCGTVFPSKVVASTVGQIGMGGPAEGDASGVAQIPHLATPSAASNAGFGAPSGEPGFGEPPAAGSGFGAPTGGPGYGAPPPGYGAPPPGYGASPAGGGGFGAPPAGGGGAGYGAPSANGGAVPGDYRVAPVGIPLPNAGPGPTRAATLGALDVGDVLGTTFELWKATFVPLATLWAICIAPGWFVSTIGLSYQAFAIRSSSGGPADLGAPVAATGLAMLGSLIQFAGVALALGPATKIGLDASARRPVDSLQASLAYGLETGFTMLGVTFLTSLAFAIGMACCCVPGAFVWCVLALAIPAAIAESRGVSDALQRSSELTDGARTEVFLVGLAVLALYIGVSIPVFCVAGGVAAGGAATGGAAAAGGTFVQQLLVFVSTSLTYSFSSLVAVVMYVRRTGFGARTDGASVANVFG